MFDLEQNAYSWTRNIEKITLKNDVLIVLYAWLQNTNLAPGTMLQYWIPFEKVFKIH